MSKTIPAKRIIVSVTNDLVTDNRVHKVCTTLTRMGFSVLLAGRCLPNSSPIDKRTYRTKRFRLFLKKGALFYAEFNIRLFIYLLFARYDLLLSNDLDTLPANFIASKFKGKPVVYDSHEYFTEVPELTKRPFVKKTWEWIEGKLLPRITHAYTVCDSIANAYKQKYDVDFKVVRNAPFAAPQPAKKQQQECPEKLILYQGAINVGRGLKQVILAMHHVKNARLMIVGDGDIKTELENLVQRENLQQKVEFTGRLSIEKLEKLTPKADLGLSVEEDMGLNYRFALPNKLFDYIRAQVPVLVSNLPEMADLVNRYQLGLITPTLEPKQLAKNIELALTDTSLREAWMKNLQIAARELCWENEEPVLNSIFQDFL